MSESLQCCKCGHPLADNQLVKDAYKVNNTTAWAKGQLRILADMLSDHGMNWFAGRLREIIDGMDTLK